MRGPSYILLLCVLYTVLDVAKCDLKLTLLHTNDMHSRFEETSPYSGQCYRGKAGDKCYGGFARLKTAVDKFRTEATQKGRTAIFLNAGDTFQGNVFYTLFKWSVASELSNMLGEDVASLGNHEFDDGPEGLLPFIVNSSTPIVCANIDYSKDPVLGKREDVKEKLVPSHILDVNGVMVGVIGYLTPDTKFLANTGEVKFIDEVTAIRNEAARLKEDGVKILIALGHSGYLMDQQIAEQVPDLDLVVGGHTNTFLYNGDRPDVNKPEGPYPTIVTQSSGRKVLVVQAYAYTKYLGHLEVDFNDEGEVVTSKGNPILVDETFRKDPEVERAVLRYSNEIKEKASMKVGFSRTFLQADHTTCRVAECNFGNLMTDALIEENAKDYAGVGWTDAPIAVVQGGALRTSISNVESGGIIKYSDLLTTLPFQNTIEKLTVSGDVIKDMLEHSVSRYDEKVGRFLQMSGIQVKYDLSKPVGQRVISAVVRCGECSVPKYSPVDVTKDYNILTSTFLAGGGDDFRVLLKAKRRVTLSVSDVNAVMNYLKTRPAVYPELSGRIQFVEEDVRINSDTNLAPSLKLNSLILITVVSLGSIINNTALHG